MDAYFDQNASRNNVELSPPAPSGRMQKSIYGGSSGNANTAASPSSVKAVALLPTSSSASPPRRSDSEGTNTLPPSSPDLLLEDGADSLPSANADEHSYAHLMRKAKATKGNGMMGTLDKAVTLSQQPIVRVRTSQPRAGSEGMIDGGWGSSSEQQHVHEDRSEATSTHQHSPTVSDASTDGADDSEQTRHKMDTRVRSPTSASVDRPQYQQQQQQRRSASSASSAQTYKLGTSERNHLEALLRARRAEERRRLDDERHRRQCTFTPRVNSASVGATSSAANEAQQHAEWAGNIDGDIGNIAQHSRRGHQQRRSASASTAAPPVEERLLQFEKQRRAKLQRELMAKIAADEARYPFAPTLDAKSRDTADRLHPPHLPVEERLLHYRSSVEESRRLLRERMALEEDLLRKMAAPMVALNRQKRRIDAATASSPRSPRAAEANSNSNGPSKTRQNIIGEEKPFLVRMREAELQRQAAVALMKDKALAEYPFRPALSAVSRAYAEARDREREAAAEQYNYEIINAGERTAIYKSGADNGTTTAAAVASFSDLNQSHAADSHQQMALPPPPPASRLDALYEDAAHRRAALEAKRRAKEVQESAAVGAPYVSAGTERIVSEGAMKDVYSACDFVQRQEIFSQLAKDHRRALKKIAAREHGGVSPQKQAKRRRQRRRAQSTPGNNGIASSIYASAATYAKKRGGYDESSDEGTDDDSSDDSFGIGLNPQPLTTEAMAEQVDRLYTQSTAVSKQLRQLLAAERLREECTFKPILSPATEAYHRATEGARPACVVQRLTAAAASSKTEGAEGNRPQTPKPTPSQAAVPKRAVTPSDADRFYRRQVAAIRHKEQRIAEARAARAVDEQRDCTFRPEFGAAVAGLVPTSSSSRHGTPSRRAASAPQSANASFRRDDDASVTVASITGTTAFLERQSLARRQRQEKEALLAAVGKGMRCNGPNYTVVRPFNLTGGRGQGREMANFFDPASHSEQPLMQGIRAESGITAAAAAEASAASSRAFGQPINPNVSVAYPFMTVGSAPRKQFLAEGASSAKSQQSRLHSSRRPAAAHSQRSELAASMRSAHVDPLASGGTTAAVAALLRATARYADGDDGVVGPPSAYAIDLAGSPPAADGRREVQHYM